LSGFVVQAQVKPATQDTVKTGFSVGKVQLKIQRVFSPPTYDPISDRYIYTSTLDGFSVNYPIILTPKNEKLVLKESMRDYFKKSWMQLKEKEGSENAKIYCRDIM
jgi:hypothetical protein